MLQFDLTGILTESLHDSKDSFVSKMV